MGVLATQTMLRRVSGDYNNNDSGIKDDDPVEHSDDWMPPRPPKKKWIRHFFANGKYLAAQYLAAHLVVNV